MPPTTASACWSSPTDRCCPPSWTSSPGACSGRWWLDGTRGSCGCRSSWTTTSRGRREAFDLPLVAPGTPFQERVWATLRQIPAGGTLSYEALAKTAGRPGAQRAAGTANGANRIAVVIPCHRVVRKSGEVGNYGGGSWRKAWLLDHERRMAEALAG